MCRPETALHIKKIWGSRSAPPWFISVDGCGLEGDPEAHLELPHLAVCLQAVDDAVPAAVNATAGIGIDWMVKHIEELRLELSLDSLRNHEVLEDRHVGQEFSRPAVLVATDATELCNARSGKGAALRDEQ